MALAKDDILNMVNKVKQAPAKGLEELATNAQFAEALLPNGQWGVDCLGTKEEGYFCVAPKGSYVVLREGALEGTKTQLALIWSIDEAGNMEFHKVQVNGKALAPEQGVNLMIDLCSVYMAKAKR